MITDKFFICAGSVTGASHKQAGRNNQDAYFIASDSEDLVAVVCDGCSSSLKSEVGANLMARFIATEALRLMKMNRVFASDILLELEQNTLAYLRGITDAFPDKGKAIDEMFLATVMGVVVNRFSTTIFSAGDGVFSLNGKINIIDEENAPTYLGYKINPGGYIVDEEKIKFIVREEVATDDVKNIQIATDGAKELEEKAGNSLFLLGKEERVGGLDQFETEGRYLKNPTLLQKRLFQINADKVSVDWEKQEVRRSKGLLTDDTTIVMIRRK